MLSRWNGFTNGDEVEWKRNKRNNKTLLEKKIKKMTDSKSIKSNEKTVLWAINRMIFFTVALAHKKHSCKYCFFLPNWNWQAVSMALSQAGKMAINILLLSYEVCRFLSSTFPSCCIAPPQSLNGNEEKSCH